MQVDLPILYSFKRCPYAIRARMALAIAKLDYVHREINLKEKHPEFIKTSRKGTVPVLVLADKIIEESIDIVTYALSLFQPMHWLALSQLAHLDADRLLAELTTSAIPAIRRIKYNPLQEDRLSEATQLNTYLSTLEKQLAGKHYLLSAPSALDVIVFPNIRQLVIHDPQWLIRNGHTACQNWLRYWTENAFFKKIFTKHPVWTPQQSAIIIHNHANQDFL